MGTDITTHQTQTVMDRLIQPLSGLFNQCKHSRKCKTISDEKWIELGLTRTILKESTGIAFLQKLIDSGKTLIKKSLFFESLKSKRRLDFCKELGGLLYNKIRTTHLENDLLSEFSCLNGYDIYAGDGHYHAAAAHDPFKGGKKYAVLHFYSLDLRSHALKQLIQADTTGDRKKEHDMRALKRLSINELRQNAPNGRKVIYAWDKAGIDFLQWEKWKNSGGIYFISREKSNMALLKMADLPFDTTNDINTGVQAYEYVGANCGIAFYRIKYKCPITGTLYVFITNLSQIPPGLVAYIYKLRWDVEKAFDEIKNKLREKKAWATSENAKNMQAEFICLAHNLMLLIEEKIISEEGIKDTININKKLKRLQRDIATANSNGIFFPSHLRKLRSTQRPLKFIRWLRNNLLNQDSWRVALAVLRMNYQYF